MTFLFLISAMVHAEPAPDYRLVAGFACNFYADHSHQQFFDLADGTFEANPPGWSKLGRRNRG